MTCGSLSIISRHSIKDHHFRYPQKAETAHLLKPIAATELTESYL